MGSFSCLERGQTLETQKNPCHAPYQSKSNRTAVGLTRQSINLAIAFLQRKMDARVKPAHDAKSVS
jgi:hypothetical protein